MGPNLSKPYKDFVKMALHVMQKCNTITAYTWALRLMIFEWDKDKNRINKEKHKLSFETAKDVFLDPNMLCKFDRTKDGEQRWHAIGYIEQELVILMAYTARMQGEKDVIRIISARKASRKERKLYENEKERIKRINADERY